MLSQNSPTRLLIFHLAFAISFPLACATADHPASHAPFSRDQIIALMHRVNDYQQAHPWKPVDNSWIRGTYYTGVMAFYQATGDPKLHEQIQRWGDSHRWQVGAEKSGGNKLTCTQTYLELSLRDHHSALIAPTLAWVNSGAPNSPFGAKVWYKEAGRRYADSLYVGPPALALLARATGDRKYLAPMHAFFWDVYDELYDKDAGLFYRDARFKTIQSHNGKKVLWSRGNGWVFAGIARILHSLPPDDPQRPKYIALFKTMAQSIARAQGQDGLWRANLADPADFPNPESSGSGFFCYGLAWGINNGLLDRETYLPVVQNAWAGLAGIVSPEGKVQWGQKVGDRPVEVHQEDTHEYVTGTFLLAGSEMVALIHGSKSLIGRIPADYF